MFVVEAINNFLQSVYVYVPQELLIIILAAITMGIIQEIKDGHQETKEFFENKKIDKTLYLIM